MMDPMVNRVANRFKAGDRKGDLVDEIETLKELQGDIEEFVFMEETATKLTHKAAQLAQKYPDLSVVARKVSGGIEDFHHRVLRELSAALDALDNSLVDREDELDLLR